MASSQDGELVSHAVRLALAARRELSEEHSRLAQLSTYKVADEWRDGLLDAVSSLATLPERCVAAPEDRHFSNGTVRQLLYRRKRGPTWRILFTVHDADANDPPTVQVHHIRHGALAPMTEWPGEDE